MRVGGQDGWDDSAVSELVFQHGHKAKAGHADFDEAEDSEATWEDKWADWSVSLLLFFITLEPRVV